MAESFVQVAPDSSGKKLHTNSYTVGANTVEDEFVIPGPYPYPTFNAIGGTISNATATDHLLCLNAGASLKVRVIRIRVEQSANATTATSASFSVYRTTTAAPTGGSAVTPAPFDTADTAGATARTLPTAKGTETTELFRFILVFRQAVGTTSAVVDDGWEWTQSAQGKPIIIPTGATNGLVVKNNTAVAGATCNVIMEFVETAF